MKTTCLIPLVAVIIGAHAQSMGYNGGLHGVGTSKGELSGNVFPTPVPSPSPTTYEIIKECPEHWKGVYQCAWTKAPSSYLPDDPDHDRYRFDCRCEVGEKGCRDSLGDYDCVEGATCARIIGGIGSSDYGFHEYLAEGKSLDYDVCVPKITSHPTMTSSECAEQRAADGAKERGDPGYCTTECPCGEGEGSCSFNQNDAQERCAAGLACVEDNGADWGYPAHIDVCTPTREPTGVPTHRPTHTWRPTPSPTPSPVVCSARDTEVGDHDFCSADCPCGHGQGSCDHGADGADGRCAAGLVCGKHNGADFGHGQFTDFCVTSEEACRRRYRRLGAAAKQTPGLDVKGAGEAEEAWFMAWCVDQAGEQAGQDDTEAREDGQHGEEQEGGEDHDGAGINLPTDPTKLDTAGDTPDTAGDDGHDDGYMYDGGAGRAPNEPGAGAGEADGFFCPSCSCCHFLPPEFVGGAMTIPAVEIAGADGAMHRITMAHMEESDLAAQLSGTGVPAAAVMAFVGAELKAWEHAQNEASAGAANDMIEGLQAVGAGFAEGIGNDEPGAGAGDHAVPNDGPGAGAGLHEGAGGGGGQQAGFYCPSCSCCTFFPPEFADGALTSPSVGIEGADGAMHQIVLTKITESELAAQLSATGVPFSTVTAFVGAELKAWEHAQNEASAGAANDMIEGLQGAGPGQDVGAGFAALTAWEHAQNEASTNAANGMIEDLQGGGDGGTEEVGQEQQGCARVKDVVAKCEAARKGWGWTCSHPDLASPEGCGDSTGSLLRDPETDACVPVCPDDNLTNAGTTKVD